MPCAIKELDRIFRKPWRKTGLRVSGRRWLLLMFLSVALLHLGGCDELGRGHADEESVSDDTLINQFHDQEKLGTTWRNYAVQSYGLWNMSAKYRFNRRQTFIGLDPNKIAPIGLGLLASLSPGAELLDSVSSSAYSCIYGYDGPMQMDSEPDEFGFSEKLTDQIGNLNYFFNSYNENEHWSLVIELHLDEYDLSSESFSIKKDDSYTRIRDPGTRASATPTLVAEVVGDKDTPPRRLPLERHAAPRAPDACAQMRGNYMIRETPEAAGSALIARGSLSPRAGYASNIHIPNRKKYFRTPRSDILCELQNALSACVIEYPDEYTKLGLTMTGLEEGLYKFNFDVSKVVILGAERFLQSKVRVPPEIARNLDYRINVQIVAANPRLESLENGFYLVVDFIDAVGVFVNEDNVVNYIGFDNLALSD